MIGFATLVSLIITGAFSLVIAGLTFRSKVVRRAIGRIWVIFNILVAFWAFSWCAAAFFLPTEQSRWFSMYLANLSAVLLPPLFLAFVQAFLNKPRG